MVNCARRWPDRFQSVCVIDQLAPDAPDVLSDLVENHAVRGLRMMGARGPGSLKDPRSFPLWERAQQLRIPICIGARSEELADVRVPLERFTSVPVALEHVWGINVGDPPYDRLEVLWEMAQFPNVRLKTAPDNSHAAREGKGTPREFFGKLVDTFGAKRIMWGSNYPAHWHHYGDMKERLAIMQDDFAFLTAENRAWIFGEAALALWPTLKGR